MNNKIFIGVGHGGSDPGAVANGLKESHLNLVAALACRDYLMARGAVVGMSRTKDENDPITEEVKECNAFKPDLAIDFHTNSGGGDGFEVFHYSKGGKSKELASNIEKEVKLLGQNSRGLKTKTGSNGKEYYAFIRDVSAPSVIIEMAFIDTLKDIKDFDEQQELKFYGEAVAKGILATLGIENNVEPKGMAILSKVSATVEQCMEWARKKGATSLFVQNAPIYFSVCTYSGVNPVVAYAQYAKETGYGKFGGVLDESFRNPCGLKIQQGGGCTDPNAHKRFYTWTDGINAHVDHLALYAGASGYPRKDTLDPRHFPYLIGKCKTVESLSGNWAPSATYGQDLVKMINEIQSIQVVAVDEYKEAVKVLHGEGIMISPEAWEDEAKINPAYVPGLIKNMAKYIKK